MDRHRFSITKLTSSRTFKPQNNPLRSQITSIGAMKRGSALDVGSGDQTGFRKGSALDTGAQRSFLINLPT